MKTTEEIITLITKKVIKTEKAVDFYWKAYKEALKEKETTANTYHSLFIEEIIKRDLYKDLLKEIFENEK